MCAFLSWLLQPAEPVNARLYMLDFKAVMNLSFIHKALAMFERRPPVQWGRIVLDV